MSFSNDKTPEEEGFTEFNKHFRFIKCIGSGGFGKVVLAEDLITKEELAVKVFIYSYHLHFIIKVH